MQHARRGKQHTGALRGKQQQPVHMRICPARSAKHVAPHTDSSRIIGVIAPTAAVRALVQQTAALDTQCMIAHPHARWCV